MGARLEKFWNHWIRASLDLVFVCGRSKWDKHRTREEGYGEKRDGNSGDIESEEKDRYGERDEDVRRRPKET